jgi:hypothetical protein
VANPRAALIAQMARARGLDPAAVLSIASVEGGFGGSIGDHGTSFGPFQLHAGGALPSGLGNPQQWANSKAGISYALDRIAQVASGLHGRQAVAAISSRFERPADVPGEIAKASGRYGQFSGGKLPMGGAALPSVGQMPRAGGGGGGNMAALQMLAQSMQSSGNTGGVSLLELLAQRQQAEAAQNVYGPAQQAMPGPGSGNGAGGIVATARKYLGIPYQWGGNDPRTGLDCSSFVQQVYAQHGIKLPRDTYDQFKVGQAVGLHNLQAGDAVFTEPGKAGPNHVGLYVGNGMVQESPHTGDVNKTIPLKDFLGGGFVGARRYQ